MSPAAPSGSRPGREVPPFPRLERDMTADVAVIGGGIVGVTTALVLHEAGVHVVLLEADRIGHGVTGHTTAKVSSQHGLIYARPARQARRRRGARLRRGQRGGAGMDRRARRARRHRLRLPPPRVLRVRDVRGRPRQVEAEAPRPPRPACPATLVETTPLPYPVAAAVRFDDQAEFHAHKYLVALARQLPGPGLRATRAPCRPADVVRTPGGRVTAEHVIVATHFPFPDRSLAFARVHPQRSYALACRIAGAPPDGMHISGDSPTRSVRAVPVDGEELLLVGGEGHRTGTGGDTEERYRRLEAFAREHWDVRSVDYRWSAQDNTTVDGLPFVGPADAVRVARTDGDRLREVGHDRTARRPRCCSPTSCSGARTPAASLFDPSRLRPRASRPSS